MISKHEMQALCGDHEKDSLSNIENYYIGQDFLPQACNLTSTTWLGMWAFTPCSKIHFKVRSIFSHIWLTCLFHSILTAFCGDVFLSYQNTGKGKLNHEIKLSRLSESNHTKIMYNLPSREHLKETIMIKFFWYTTLRNRSNKEESVYFQKNQKSDIR